MSENFQEIPENFSKISAKDNLFDAGDGVSYAKIPRNLYKLRKLIPGASANDVLVGLALAEFSVTKRHYPTFSVRQSELAEVTGLSTRAISNSVRFLTLNKVLYVRSSMGVPNQYTWNEEFLRGAAPVSVGVLNHVQKGYCNTFSRGTEPYACIYIEFSLEIFISSFKEFFSEHQPDYNFYVPAKRSKKGIKKDAPQGSGATIQVSRRDAWKEAAYHCYEKIKNYDDALSRIYLGLMASRNIEDVTFPKAALLYRVTDGLSINESRSKSHLKHVLHHDDDFKEFINQKLQERGH